VVVPGLADGVAVERFPTCEGGCLGEDSGELRALAVESAVAQQIGNLLDGAAELVQDGDPAEAAVDVAGVLDLLAEQVDGCGVDGAGDGQPRLQLGRFLVFEFGREAEFLVCAAVDLAEQPPVYRLAYRFVPVFPA
jgi:hypothetical protein